MSKRKRSGARRPGNPAGPRYKATMPPAFTFESQVIQYPADGPPGISYFAGPTEWGDVDCLLYRDDDGQLVGILNHYGFDNPWEKAGNVNVFVRDDRKRQGIGTALVREAMRRWSIDPDSQRYTREGAAWANRMHRRLRGS